jgi:hypothetical protein
MATRPLGGWLLLFAVLQTLGLGYSAYGMARTLRTIWLVRRGVTAAGRVVRLFASVRFAGDLLVFGAIAFGILLIQRRHPQTRLFWLTFYLFLLPVRFCFHWLRVQEHRALLGVGVSDALPRNVVVAGFVGAAFWAIVWGGYWYRSRRVRETFAPAPGLAA